MKKFILGSLSFIGLLGFTSCGGASTEAPNSSVSADTTKSKKVEIVESKEPQTACDCFEKWNPEIEKLLNTSMKELAEKPLLFEDFGEKISNDENLNNNHGNSVNNQNTIDSSKALPLTMSNNGN